MIQLTVLGDPQPQGSKNVSRSGHTYEQNAVKLRPWRQAVAQEAALAMRIYNSPQTSATRSPWYPKPDGHMKPLSGPVSVTISFYFRRPKGHYGTGRNEGVVKANAPLWKTTAPDSDKLARAALDSLTGVVIRDDSQVVALHVRKMYDGTPRAEISVALITS